MDQKFLFLLFHAVQDLYSHSNYVEIYAATYPEQTDVTKIPTITEALNDPAYAQLKVALMSSEKDADGVSKGLHTGKYPGEGPGSHQGTNHDLGAGASSLDKNLLKAVKKELQGKKVDWYSKAAEAVATKASKEYLNTVKQKVEKK